MKRKTICIVMIFILAFTFCLGSGMAYAETKEELENELGQVQQNQAQLSAKLDDVKAQIAEKQPSVDALNAEVEEANAKVAEIEAEIAKKQQEMKDREEGLNARLRVMYKNGSVGFMDVLLGSRSISEFISNLEMIQQIYENDMNVLNTLEKEQEELKKIGEELKAEKAVLDEKKVKLDDEMNELLQLKGQIELAEIEFQAEADRLNDEIQKLINVDTEFVGGAYIWPAPGHRMIPLMGTYGDRPYHPVTGKPAWHDGLDITGNGINNSPAVAAASGTVIVSSYSYGYGNYVTIDHGAGVTTTYAHLNSRSVRVGQQVTGGQTIGLIGSTGISSGAHLHFEIRFSGRSADPLGYVRPNGALIYLPY